MKKTGNSWSPKHPRINKWLLGDFHPFLMCPGSKLSFFPYKGTRHGHQPNSKGLYTHYKDSVIKGGKTPTHPPKKPDNLDHGTCKDFPLHHPIDFQCVKDSRFHPSRFLFFEFTEISSTLRILKNVGRGVKNTCFEASGVSRLEGLVFP